MGDVQAAEAAARTGLLAPVAAYARSLWRGDILLVRAFWTDMVVIGSVVNIFATAAAMLLFVTGAPIALGVIVHFAPVPYNILLFLGVWQSAARATSRWSFAAQTAAVVWLIFFIVI